MDEIFQDKSKISDSEEKKKLIKPKLLLEKLNKIDKPLESPTKKTDNIIMKMEIQIYKEEIKRIIVY